MGGEGFPWLFKRKSGTPESPKEIAHLREKSSSLEAKLAELGSQIETAKQRMNFLIEEHRNRLGEYLNQPENARRLFDAQGPTVKGEASAATRAQLLQEWMHRLEERDLLFHVLASYEVRKLHTEYCPPVHLQALKKALVNREEAKRVETILEQFPARKISMKRLEEASRAIRRRTPEEQAAAALQFAEDLMRLRRDRRNYQHVAAWMDRINLVRSEHVRELSRANKSLYEFLHPSEGRPADDPVINHTIIKADVRGSTGITKDLLARGMNPASHISMNLHEPVKRILERFGAATVFHRRRRDHSGDRRDGVHASNCARSGSRLRSGARNSGGDASVQPARENQWTSRAGAWRGSSISRFRAVFVDRWRFENHDFARAESFRPSFKLLENSQTAVSQESLAI